ncbi:MAG TPA: TPM domain-containing protein [Patescibacteria group bacterium]|nr:TPM domain-containing protein [Patescibacteria group bacterium]
MASATFAAAATPTFPALTGRVVDDARVLSASTRGSLTEMLAEHERTTGQQIVVVTLASLQGLTIEDFGYQLGRAWGIGQEGKDNGVLLIVAPKEHKVRIEVGYGLEGTLTDAISRTIIERAILPNFRRGDFDAGVVDGTTSILKVLSGEPVANVTRASGNTASLVAAAVITTFAIVWLLLVFFRFRSLTRVGRRGRYGIYWGPSPGGWSSGGFGGGGGGGFSGGGGSFGGGGASGSW